MQLKMNGNSDDIEDGFTYSSGIILFNINFKRGSQSPGLSRVRVV